MYSSLNLILPSMDSSPHAAQTPSEYHTDPVRSKRPVGDTKMPEPESTFDLLVQPLSKPMGCLATLLCFKLFAVALWKFAGLIRYASD